MAGRALKTLTWLVVAGLIAVVAILAWGHRSFNAPGPLQADRTLILPRGELHGSRAALVTTRDRRAVESGQKGPEIGLHRLSHLLTAPVHDISTGTDDGTYALPTTVLHAG